MLIFNRSSTTGIKSLISVVLVILYYLASERMVLDVVICLIVDVTFVCTGVNFLNVPLIFSCVRENEVSSGIKGDKKVSFNTMSMVGKNKLREKGGDSNRC